MREYIATWPQGWANRESLLSETLSGTRVLTAIEIDAYNLFFLDPGGSARTVDLPAEEGASGATLIIINTADQSEAITVRNDAGSTRGTIEQNEAARFVCDGTNWYSLVGANT